MNDTPTLLQRLNEDHCIDTRWIAQATGRKLNHIHDQLLKIRDGRDFGHQADSRGYVTNVWLPLPDALILLSQFEGPRAAKARAFIREALEFYIHEAPRLREEVAALRAQRPAHVPGMRAKKLPMPVVQQSLFGDAPVVHYVLMPIDTAHPVAVDKGRLRHLQRQMEGIARQINSIQRRLDGETH